MHQEKPHRARVSVALRDGEFMELQAAALEVATIAIAITDREGTILWINSAFQQLTGCRREDVPGRSIHLPKSDLVAWIIPKNVLSLVFQRWG